MTSLRFPAAVLVFLCHSTVIHVFADQRVNDLMSTLTVRSGLSAVEFFFILSGFVLAFSHQPDDTTGAFWLRRAAKIYPNNLVGCALAVLGLVIIGQPVDKPVLAANALLVHAWWPSVPLLAGVNVPSWSLSAELLFYLAFPALLPLLRRIPERLLWTAFWVIVAVIFVMPILADLLPGTPLFAEGTSLPRYWLVYFCPPVRMLEFVMGILLARIVQAGRWIRIGQGPALLLVALALVIQTQVSLLYAAVAVLIVPLALLVGAAASGDVRETRSPMRTRSAVRLGELAFAVYIVHYQVLIYGDRLLGGRTWGTAAGFGVLAGMFAVTLALAWPLYRFVERPVVRITAARSPTLVG
ncbi:MAG TPA: acyltransferase [Pseudonocardiaceae bacterium]|nr:acyltransferase [Pseudonocardiaceae bacterium]